MSTQTVQEALPEKFKSRPDAARPTITDTFDVEVRPVSPLIGAEISGVDLAKPLTPSSAADIQNALAEHGVIFFREQVLTPEQHIAFAEQFGEIEINRFFKPVPNYPMIAEVRKEAHHKANIGGNWHTDHSYDEIPAKISMLYGRELPEVGGDTVFASMYAAFETLSEGLKTTLRGLKAVHSSRHVFGAESRRRTETDLPGRILNPELAVQDATHPVVFRHPQTGREALYVNPGFTLRFDGWSQAESTALLDFLYEHANAAEFACRFRWQPGSLAVWDNRITWHLAVNDYSGHARLLHRITIKGEPLS